jgi:hypothetical protein
LGVCERQVANWAAGEGADLSPEEGQRRKKLRGSILPSLTGDQEFPSIEERSLRAEWTILFPSNYPQAPPPPPFS